MRSSCSYKVDRDVTLERCEALHAAEAVRQNDLAWSYEAPNLIAAYEHAGRR